MPQNTSGNRYQVNKINKDLFEIYDNCLGDILYCSFTTQESADKLCDKKNLESQTAERYNVKWTKYKGRQRTVKYAAYRTPKLKLEILNRMVVISYA